MGKLNQQRRRCRTWFLLAAAGASFCAPARGAPDSLEYPVKAAFLLNFTKFVDWPASAFAEPGSPIVICILGDDPFGSALDEVVNGEMVNGRPLAVLRIKRPPERKACQVLFVNSAVKDVPKSLSEAGSGVLTVGEGAGFLDSGGMIALVIDNRRVRFDINPAAAQAAGLKLSSKLLKVARVVQGPTGR